MTEYGDARLSELDGIRGWAAMTVVSYHIIWETFGYYDPHIRNAISAIILNRALAVAVFFVLSGEALSTGYFSGKGESAVMANAVRRYSRLTIPIVASTAVIFALLKLDLVPTGAAGAIVHSKWMSSFLAQVPHSAFYFVRYALFEVYAKTDGRLQPNPFLWTMHFELIGSLLVFAVLLGYRYMLNAWAIILTAAAALAVMDDGFSNYSCFLFGIITAAMRQNGVFKRWQQLPHSQLVSWTVIGLTLVVGGISRLNLRLSWEHSVFFAVPLLWAVFMNKSATKVFASAPARFFGAISFPIFLIQFPVIASYTALAILYANKDGQVSHMEAAAVIVSSFIVCIAAAFVFLPVERMTKVIGKRITKFAMGRPMMLFNGRKTENWSGT